MKRNCNFQMNPALAAGIAINLAVTLLHTLIEPAGSLNLAFCFVQGTAVGLMLIGLLCGSPKTRPLFNRFRAFKLRLSGR